MVSQPIVGSPRVYERATISPKTAADIMFSGLSAATLCSSRSMPTATPTATSATMSESKPNAMYDIAVSTASAMNVYVISLSLVIDAYSLGFDILRHKLLVSLLSILSRFNWLIRLSKSGVCFVGWLFACACSWGNSGKRVIFRVLLGGVGVWFG